MQSKHESLARFIYTIRPLREVYTLPPTSLHIFYDRTGELIAFNRNASLFLNLRYFEQWRERRTFALLVGVLLTSRAFFRRRGSPIRQPRECVHIMVCRTRFLLRPLTERSAGTSRSRMRSRTTSCKPTTPSTNSTSRRYVNSICRHL